MGTKTDINCRSQPIRLAKVDGRFDIGQDHAPDVPRPDAMSEQRRSEYLAADRSLRRVLHELGTKGAPERVPSLLNRIPRPGGSGGESGGHSRLIRSKPVPWLLSGGIWR